MTRVALAVATALVALGAAGPADAQFMTGRRVEKERTAAEAAAFTTRQLVEQVGFDQKLGDALPLELAFRDETGRAVRLGDYFGSKPVVLGLVYYRCPVLCTLVERGLATGLKPLELEPGSDFEVVFVSIDPTDTPELAAERKAATLASYGRPATSAGWHFLSGDAESIRRLTEAVGFRYAYDAGTNQYAHAAGLSVATPEGRLSRYLFGLDYAPRDLKLSLVESSDGRIGSPIDKLLLVCFEYDAAMGKYTAATLLTLKAGATLTLAALVSFLVLALRRERRGRSVAAGGVA